MTVVLLKIVFAIQLMSALAMIGLILIQHGKGADMGAAFGSGGSGSLFGASGGANFMSRSTAVLAGVFFACTLALAYFTNLRPTSSGSVLDGAAISAPAAPAAPASGAALIPGNTASPTPAAAPVAATPAPAAAASGAAQIPTK